MKEIALQRNNVIDFVTESGELVACVVLPSHLPLNVPAPGSFVSWWQWDEEKQVVTYQVTQRPPHYRYGDDETTVEICVEPVSGASAASADSQQTA